MRLTKLLGLVAMALFAFGAIGTSMAGAVEKEEEGKPQILCFVEKCITGVSIPTSGGASTLETLGGLTLTGTSVTSTLIGIKVGSSEKDGSLAGDVEIRFLGVKKGAQLCHTEGGSAETGEVAALLDLHVSAGTSAGKELVPLLLAKVLNKVLTAELEIKCGVIKTLVKGTIPCALSPGLVAITTAKEVEVHCGLNKETHDQSTRITCTQLCTENEKDPFEAKLSDKFEDAGMEITLKGNPNKEIYIDD